MRAFHIWIFALNICLSTFGQADKTIIVTKNPKTVPAGKQWILVSGSTTRVQVSYGIYNSGSLCNALFLSIPGIVSTVNRGTIFTTDSYLIIFKDAEKIEYTNEYTYDLSVLSIADKNFSVKDFQNKSSEEVGFNRIEFKAGESVFVGNCLESIELKEINLTQKELILNKKREDEITRANQLKFSNFNIPSSEKYCGTGNKPEIHDSKLKSIAFSSSAVLYRKPGVGYVLDDISIWTLTLNIDKLTLESSNGINKTYSVLKIEYNDQMKGQLFLLGNSDIETTHNLSVSWSNSLNQYLLILSSIDNTEEYQFQEVQSTDKQYQIK